MLFLKIEIFICAGILKFLQNVNISLLIQKNNIILLKDPRNNTSKHVISGFMAKAMLQGLKENIWIPYK